MKFIDLFHKHVNEQPDHLALVDGDGSLTYGQLNDKAETLAKEYASKGIEAGDAVGVKVPYGKDIMVHAIAVHKLGAVYVPIDDTYPEDRVKYMLEDSKKEKHDGNVALILYTSGTTGRPKGVVHTQQSLMSMVDTSWLPIPMSSDTRCGVVTGFTFVATTMMLFSTIAAGGTLYFADTVERLDMSALHQFLQRNGITHIFMSANLGMGMMETNDTTGTLVMVGGEKLRGFKSVTGQRLLNCYGSTEGVMVCSAYVNGTEKEIPIGNPCQGVTARIIDENLHDVPFGEVGELIYNAPFMAREYLHLLEQTNEKWFYLDGVRYYHTGDRVRQGFGNALYCLGRTDNMVKVRGFRVETGEVERQLSLAIPNTEVAVVLRRVHGIDHLVCFYQADKELNAAQVKSEISKTLAEYMVPDIWVRIDCFPRNTNGKVVRNELNIPTETSRLSVIYNEVEMRIVEAAKLITGNIVSLDDNFFECGGTSLGAIKLATQLKTMGIHITGSKIMQLKQLRKVAKEATVDYERLWTAEQWQEIQESFMSRGENIQKVMPLSTEYEDMLIRFLMHQNNTAHRAVYALKLDSQIDQHLLCNIIKDIAEKNEDLRLRIAIHHRYPFQIVYIDKSPQIENFLCKESPFNGAAGNFTIKDIYTYLMHIPYDPEWDSLLRFAYIDNSDGSSYLFVLAYDIRMSLPLARTAIYSIMDKLQEHYPSDISIRDWRDVLSYSLLSHSLEKEEDVKSKCLNHDIDNVCKTKENGLIRIYSSIEEGKEGNKPSVVFVHTGNTGSDAYYRLADKIGEDCAFAVIEPYNLFHRDDIQHGIKAIARKYVEILRNYQPKGPYILGGWCYGGVVAHEMACQLHEIGETVSHLIIFDSHALANEKLISKAKYALGDIDRRYFETSPLFEDLREQGFLDDMVRNSAQVNYDLLHHTPSMFHGPVTYFKPLQTPMAATGKALNYWKKMMEFDAGNYENYCDRETLRIFNTPHEHDLMMDDESLAITVPILKEIIKRKSYS